MTNASAKGPGEARIAEAFPGFRTTQLPRFRPCSDGGARRYTGTMNVAMVGPSGN